MERPVKVGRAIEDRGPEGGAIVALERRVPSTDGLQRMGIRAADLREAVLVGEPDDAFVPRPAERRRVERLDAVGMEAGRVGQEP